MEKIWLKSYPAGVPAEINPDAYQSLVDVFTQSCQQFPHHPAFYSLGVTLTYQALQDYSLVFAAYLQQVLQVKHGDRVAIMLPNILQYPIALLGALQAGATVVNVNPLYTVPELIHQLQDAGVETIIVLENFAATVQQSLAVTAVKNIIVTRVGDLLPMPKAFLLHIILKYLKRKIPAWHIPQALRWKEMLRAGKKLTLQPVHIANSDIAFLQYTGGTTGVAKGAMLTHRNIIANIQQASTWFGALLHAGQEIMITALPLYHIFSLTANCLFVMKIGGLNVLIANPRDVKGMIADMRKFSFTMLTGVNTLFNGLLKCPTFAQLDFKAFKLALGGGMAVQHTVAEKWQAMTGVTLLEAYGLTETSPCVCLNPSYLKNFNGSVGLPVPSTEVCLFDDKGNPLPINQVGELGVKGPQVMKGYWQHPLETQKVFTHDGWLLTGDIASIDAEGFVRILERKKDMILVSGFNVYPNEIEDVLVSIKGVLEAAVIGVPDENSGEVVKAYIVKEDPLLTADEVLYGCRQSLTGYKVPKYIEFCQELPKSNVGKIMRRQLRVNG